MFTTLIILMQMAIIVKFIMTQRCKNLWQELFLIFFYFFLVCDNLLGDFCYLHRLNHAKAWQPPFLNLLIAQWANVWRQMYRSTHDLEMLELLWFMSIVHCLIQLPTSRKSLHIFCSGRSWWKPKAPMINDGKFMKRNKYVICTSFW